MADLVGSIAEAIATMEGYYLSGSLAARNNNPGNLRSWGSRPIRSGFAYFDSADAGWSALRRQVSLLIDMDLTLYEFFGGKPGVYPGYAPSTDNNNPGKYAEFVAERIGYPPDQPLSGAGTSDSLPINIVGGIVSLLFVVLLLKQRG